MLWLGGLCRWEGLVFLKWTPTVYGSVRARFRRAVRTRGHFPNEQAALKTLYLVTRSLDPIGTGQKRWITRWKPALNAFAITSADR
jgi:transposase-like protein